VVADLPLAYFHVFSYSARPGTAATRFKSQVPAQTIKDRSTNLSKLSRVKRAEFYRRFVDRHVSVLFESSQSVGWWSGLTDNYIRVKVPSMTVLDNEIHSVHLTGVMGESAVGQLLSEEDRSIKKQRALGIPKKGLGTQVWPVFFS
jgi:threonylcarbamoyladenosine tRNA methylthiotransferase MtaB